MLKLAFFINFYLVFRKLLDLTGKKEESGTFRQNSRPCEHKTSTCEHPLYTPYRLIRAFLVCLLFISYDLIEKFDEKRYDSIEKFHRYFTDWGSVHYFWWNFIMAINEVENRVIQYETPQKNPIISGHPLMRQSSHWWLFPFFHTNDSSNSRFKKWLYTRKKGTNFHLILLECAS